MSAFTAPAFFRAAMICPSFSFMCSIVKIFTGEASSLAEKSTGGDVIVTSILAAKRNMAALARRQQLVAFTAGIGKFGRFQYRRSKNILEKVRISEAIEKQQFWYRICDISATDRFQRKACL